MSYPPCKSFVSCSSNPSHFPFFSYSLLYAFKLPLICLSSIHSPHTLLPASWLRLGSQSSLMLSPNLLVSVIT